MEAVPRLSEYGYHQAGWSEAALPVMEVALIFTLTMFAWETYLHLRQHSRLERKGGVIPAKLKELVQVVDAQALAKKKSGVVEPLAKAHCVVGPDGKPSEGKAAKAANCNGTVSFAMSEDEAECTISWELEGLKEGKHSLYVHEKADFSSGYKSTGSQYNPHGKATDGSAEKEEDKPVGDLGKDVVVAGKDGKASGSVKSKAVKLNGAVSVLGRSVLVAKVGAGNIAGGAIKAGEHGKIEDGKALEAMEKDVPKFQLYNLDKSSFGLVKSVFDLSLEIAFVVMGMYPFFWDISAWVVGEGFLGKDPAEAEALVSLVLLGLVVLQDTVVSIPWSLYSNFVVEEKHGFNKMTLTLFVTDLLTTLALTAAIGGPITWLLIRLIKWGGEYFYVYCWAFMFLFSIVMMTIFPLYIQPLFNKYVELPEGELKAAIYGLAKRLNFPLTKLYQVDGSKRSSHSNAYLFGFGQNKRIVLFDTLVKQMTVPELEAVLGHEIGHWAHGHVLQMFVSTEGRRASKQASEQQKMIMLSSFFFLTLPLTHSLLHLSPSLTLPPN